MVSDRDVARQLHVEFDYELDVHEVPISMTSFALAPDVFFVTDGVEGLDFTLIAIGDRIQGSRELAS